MAPPKLTDQQLLELVIAADDEGLSAGEDPKQRSMTTVSRVMKKLGIDGYVVIGTGTHPLVSRIQQIIRMLYRPRDLAIGGIHMGLFMFRDVFARVSIPLGFGHFQVTPMDHVI